MIVQTQARLDLPLKDLNSNWVTDDGNIQMDRVKNITVNETKTNDKNGFSECY